MSSNVPPAAAPAPATPPPAPATAAAPAPATGPAIALAPGQALVVSPGQALAARVVAVQAGQIELAVAGGLVTAASDLPLEPGQTLRLVVADAGADRVTLRLAPEAHPATMPAGPAATLTAAGVPPAAASALLAALSEQGAEIPTGAAAATLAARAVAAGVQTPAQAAAFARLDAAGLPTTPAAVAGLARLLDGAPLGRALTALLDAAAPRAATTPPPTATPTPTAPGTGPATATVDANWRGASTPIGAQATPPAAPAAPGAATLGAGASAGAGPSGPPLNATPGPVTAGAASTHDGPEAQLRALVATMGSRADDIGSGATGGHAAALRRAIADLGTGLEPRLHAGSLPDEAPLRSLLMALAAHPAADPALARAASGLADGLAAQTLAGATLPPPAGPDPSAQNGAYLQLPLPGGGTAEVRVSPDGGREGADGDRPRRLAFLLHLSALGPVMIEATAGPRGVDATVRTSSDAARGFLGEQAGALIEALRRTSRSASVSVERMSGPAPERLLAPPPSSGLDLSA